MRQGRRLSRSRVACEPEGVTSRRAARRREAGRRARPSGSGRRGRRRRGRSGQQDSLFSRRTWETVRISSIQDSLRLSAAPRASESPMAAMTWAADSRKDFHHFRGRETEFFAAHAAKQAAQREETKAHAFGLAEKRKHALALNAVVRSACGESLLRERAGLGRRRRLHQAGGRCGGLRQSGVEIGERATLGIVATDRPERE